MSPHPPSATAPQCLTSAQGILSTVSGSSLWFVPSEGTQISRGSPEFHLKKKKKVLSLPGSFLLENSTPVAQRVSSLSLNRGCAESLSVNNNSQPPEPLAATGSGVKNHSRLQGIFPYLESMSSVLLLRTSLPSCSKWHRPGQLVLRHEASVPSAHPHAY